MKNVIKKIFRLFDIELIRASTYNNLKINRRDLKIDDLKDQTMNAGMKRLLQNKINPSNIIDIGAAKGTWTRLAMNYWPDSKYYLLEPIKEQITQLDPTVYRNTRIKIIEGVAGDADGYIQINITKDLDGSGIYGNSDNSRKVRSYTLDELLKNENGDYLIKLDTHGYEIPIFEGAKEILKNTIVIVVEVYGFHVSPTGQLFHDVSGYLLGKGFRLFDIVDVMRRAKDNAFWQADAVYLKKDHPVFSNNQYL